MARFQTGNTTGEKTRFQTGQSGNSRGRPRASATVREWWNRLLEEDDDGNPKFTVSEIWHLAEAKNDDKTISPAKRIAARMITEMVNGGRQGREVLALLFDRSEGRPSQNVNLSGLGAPDPSLEITEATLASIRQAAAGNGQD